ncbi:MAG: PD-(D/E)XK nuclease family protein [Acidobacteriota bacterium]|nr:PD-(D/E)XK nuclease family protein [Acidobacteriota bacterium]
MRFAFPGLFSCFEKNVTVIAPSRLLAAVAYQQFATSSLQNGRASWGRPAILSLGGWLTNCWTQARYSSADIPSLLSASQEHLLWKRIIEADGLDLFDTNATAHMASRAARLISEWELQPGGEDWEDGSDARQFGRWLHAFHRTCKHEGWITRADIWRFLPSWIAEKRCSSAPLAFPVIGTPVPALERVFRMLGDRASIEHLTPPGVRMPVGGTEFPDLSAEWEFAARWARQAFESKGSQSIGVFVPDLVEHRSSIDRIFRQVFHGGTCRALIDERLAAGFFDNGAFNIHARAPLTSEPLVAGALQLLGLAQPCLSVAQAGAILRSPWLSGATEERSLRALVDLELRRRRELEVTFTDIESASARCRQLTKIWSSVHPSLARKPETDTFAGWSEFIGDLLASLGWPGDDELNDLEQSIIEKWSDALSQLAALSLVSDAVTLDEALDQLKRLLSIGFVPQNPWAPVQILDAAEAQGLQFDTALLTGLSDESWPPPSYSSPLVPLKIQRKQGVIGSSPHSLRTEWGQKTAWLFGSAPAPFATWSGRLSPLAEEFVSQNRSPLPVWTGKSAWQSFKPAILDETIDVQAPAFEPGAVTRGGTSIIKSQSLCPFRAFAEFRLNANSPEEGCLGLDARERGGYLHKALEFVWQKLRTRDNLRATPPAQLAQLVEESAREAVRTGEGSSFRKIVASVEVERLKNVILDWLAIERDRQIPFTVETVEQERLFNLAGLPIRLRMDRIDRLPNGKLLLIDYKSGDTSYKKLEGERPAEPQLLVYAASAETEVDGLFFGQFKPQELRFKGISRERHFKGQNNQIKKDWREFLSDSRDEVYRLAKQFKDGFAAVDPSKGACDYCSQRPFCRINEIRGGEEIEE